MHETSRSLLHTDENCLCSLHKLVEVIAGIEVCGAKHSYVNLRNLPRQVRAERCCWFGSRA